VPVVGLHGSLMQFRDWLKIRRKLQQLAAAQEASEAKAEALSQQRAALATSLENAKGGISELAQHTKSAKAAAAAAAGPHAPHTHEDATALLSRTKLITADQKLLTLLDRQTADLRQLAGVYRQWSGVVALQSNAVLHKLLLDAAVVLGILLAVLLVDKWAQRLLNNPKLDRRQVETLRSITRVSLRVIAAVIILLILIGMPSQFGTMIGIVGAGLTVVVPAGQDPYRIIDDLTKQVTEATAESARQAEQEWQRAVPTQRGKTFSGTPGVSVKPVVGGVEIAVRYITRAHERFQLRAALYQAAVHLLGQKAVKAADTIQPAG
jgi:hypothetical protein